MRKIIALLLFQFIALHALATDFTVTSNADSGPGTLRQALTDAAQNGSATQDRIIFNIADQSEAGRTITLQSQLPDVSSNLSIDGSTQTGSCFGLSNARVKVSTPHNYIAMTIFNGQNIDNVSFFGLYIYDYSDMVISRPDLKQRIGIKLINSSNIIIGAINKGNLIRGFKYSCLDIEQTNNIKIQGNIIGLSKLNTMANEGEDLGGGYSGEVLLLKCDKIFLGGRSLTEGNVIFTKINISFYQQSNNTVAIKSNNFEVYPDGVSGEPFFDLGLAVEIKTDLNGGLITEDQFRAASAFVDMDISNNVSGGVFPVFLFEYIKGTVNFTGNYFNVARDGVTDITKDHIAYFQSLPINTTSSTAQFNIGTNDPGQKNFFNKSLSCIIINSNPNVFMRYNSFRCISDNAYKNNASGYQLPMISISGISTSGSQANVTGKATPLSLVDIYSSESCNGKCSIRNYMKTVNADAAGNWQADIDNFGGIFYASATLNDQTSEFKTFEVNKDNINIKPMRCTDVATISGLKVPQGVSYYWTDYNGNIVSRDLDLVTTKPGDYRLILSEGCISSDWFKVEDKRLNIYDGFSTRTVPACGTTSGSIKGLYVYDPLSKLAGMTWTDAAGKEVGHAADISGLTPGIYTLTVTSTDGCSASYVLNLTNSTGPQITQTNTIVTGTNCGESNGSITNITATGSGTIVYTWKNAQGVQVGNTADLLDKPPGNYTLQVNDNSSCGPVYSSVITIPQLNGISIDEGRVIPAPVTCDGTGYGTITGIVVTGATANTIYEWYDESDHLKGKTREPSFSTLSPGKYYMKVTDGACSSRTTLYTIGQQTNTTDYARHLTPTITNASCGNNDGAISVAIGTPANADIKAYRWVAKSNAVTLSSTINKVTGLDAGAYQLYITSNNNCEKLVSEFTVDRTPGLNIATDRLQVRNDVCNQGLGSITGLKINEAAGKPATCKWTDATGATVGTAADLLNRRAGTYTLNVTDGTICGKTLVYTISNNFSALRAPSVSDVQLCSAGDALLNISGATTGYSYRLYDSPNSISPVDVQASGKFKITVTSNRNYYVSQFVGDCESTRAEVKVILGGLSALKLPNAISPNGDGVNDTWKLPDIESYPTANVQIYTRAGQKVFESVGYATPFNGVYNGKPLAAGTYYYIINLNTGCSLLSGNLTIIR